MAFYKINDVVLNVSKIKRFYPTKKKANRDRAYTHEKNHSMLDIPDERMRVILLLLASSGMCVGAIPLLRLRNLTKVNPFDSGKDFLGVDNRKLRKKRERQKEFDHINDEDLKRELKKGSTLISYVEN